MHEVLFKDAIREALVEELQRDDAVVLIGSSVRFPKTENSCTRGLIDRFGSRRIVDGPIAASGLAGAAIGAALAGLKPVVEFENYNQFLNALEQISSAASIHQLTVGALKTPVVFRGPGIGLLPAYTQNNPSIAGYFSAVPGLVVVAPATPEDAKGLLKSAIRSDNPVIYLEAGEIYNHRGMIPEDEYFTDLGKAVVRKSGSDVSLISWSKNIDIALQAASGLEEEGFSIEIIDLRTLHPLDELTLLNSVAKTRRAIIIQEQYENTSFGAHLCQRINSGVFDRLLAPVSIISTLGTPLPYSASLLETVGLSTSECVERIKGILDHGHNTI